MLSEPFNHQIKILEDVIGNATYVIEITKTNLAKNGEGVRTPADIELLKSTTILSLGVLCLFCPIIIADYCNDDGKFLLEKMARSASEERDVIDFGQAAIEIGKLAAQTLRANA